MKSIYIALTALLMCLAGSAPADNSKAQYDWMTKLSGDWKLAPAEMQVGKATQHKLVAPLMGTDATAMQFKTIGKGSTVQERLLPDSKKEMVTMYHCKDISCSAVKATHYCVKQNQPEMLISPDTSNNRIVYDCDMSTDLCQSRQDHVHRITHELSDDGRFLKTTYTSFADGQYLKDSVYQFERK